MREILFRGRRTDNDKWVEGFYLTSPEFDNIGISVITAINPRHPHYVFKNTVGQYTGLTDKNDTKIFEGDIVQYINDDDFDCQSIVKFGEYKQDGSGGEYRGRSCIGFYVKVDNFTCPDWCDDDPEDFPRHMWYQNILEVASQCEVIGNIYDNPELLED